MEDRIRMLECISIESEEKNIDLMDQFVKLMENNSIYTRSIACTRQMREIYTIMILFFLKTKKKCLELKKKCT